MSTPEPTRADMDRAAVVLAGLCVRNDGDPADLALTLGAIGYLPTQDALRKAEVLGHRTPAVEPVQAQPEPTTARLCRKGVHPWMSGGCGRCRNERKRQQRAALRTERKAS